MDVTPEQVESLFKRREPDMKICLHELRIEPIKLTVPRHGRRYGYIARMLGHGVDGKPVLIDFVTYEDTLQEIGDRIGESGMKSAFSEAMDAANEGDPSALFEILTIVAGGDEGELS